MLAKYVLALALALSTVGVNASPAASRPGTHASMAAAITERIIPIFVIIDPSSPTAGSQVTITIEMDAVAEEDTTVYLTASEGAFSSLPTSAVVETGNDYAVVQAVVSTSAGGAISVSATANGKTAQGTALVISQ